MIEKLQEEYHLACDNCRFSLGMFDSFDEAQENAKKEEWKMKKVSTGWIHLCPDCAKEV